MQDVSGINNNASVHRERVVSSPASWQDSSSQSSGAETKLSFMDPRERNSLSVFSIFLGQDVAIGALRKTVAEIVEPQLQQLRQQQLDAAPRCRASRPR